MSFQQQDSSQDVVGHPVKKNKGIISRMKRSLSTSGGKPPQPLKLPLRQPSSISELDTPQVKLNPSRSFSPVPSTTLTSPLPTHYGIPSPTTHLSYETFASTSASNLSVRSFPTIRRRASSNDTTNPPLRVLPTIPSEIAQAKSMFESRLVQDERISLTKLVPLSATKLFNPKEEISSVAPAPSMYWSRPQVYGTKLPPLRAHATVIHNEKLYLYGGTGKSQCSDALYILDLDSFTWFKPRTFGIRPPACRAHCMLVDPVTASIYLFGGGDGTHYFNDVFVLNMDTLTWTKPKAQGNIPSPRRAHASCIWKQKIIIVGGGDGIRALADVYCLDVSDPDTVTWSHLPTTGKIPDARGYHTGNLVKDKLVIYGGSDGHDCFGDVHVLDLVLNRWSQIKLDCAITRQAHSATQVGSYLFVIAGHDGKRYSNEVSLLNLVTMVWEKRKIYGVSPTPRGYHSSILHDSRLYIIGGYDGKEIFNDMYILELSTCAYLPQITNFEIDM